MRTVEFADPLRHFGGAARQTDKYAWAVFVRYGSPRDIPAPMCPILRWRIDVRLLRLVMVTGLEKGHKLSRDFINQPVFGGNPSGPAARKIKPHWLRLANSLERTAHHILHKVQNAQSNFAVAPGPILKIFPEL
jgi:hypothetical protein